MWSLESRGGASVLGAQQRVLFPVASGADATAQQLVRALSSGVCSGVALLAPDDRRACRALRAALEGACARNPLLSRSRFAVVVETGAALLWAADCLIERVQLLLESLQLETLDLLLLRAQSLTLMDAGASAYETKRAVLQLWAAALELQQRGLVAQLGVSGFSIQQTEFILTAHPQHPPVATLVDARFLPAAAPAGGDEEAASACSPLARTVAFAHGRAMDVLVRVSIRGLDALPLAWQRVVHSIALAHRAQSFEVAVTHEADSAPSRTLSLPMADTPALQTPVQIAVRYLLQKGLVVVPTAADEGEADAPFEDDESHELFYSLLHPFAALGPSHSPTQLYSSILPPEAMAAIAQTLRLVVEQRVHR